MRTLYAAALLCVLASAASAQTYVHHHHHARANEIARSERAYEDFAPANGGTFYESHTRGEGGAAWEPGSANGQ